MFDISLIFAQNMACRRGGSNEYPQCMFWIKIKKIMYTPANPSFYYIKLGIRVYTFHGHIILMDLEIANNTPTESARLKIIA